MQRYCMLWSRGSPEKDAGGSWVLYSDAHAQAVADAGRIKELTIALEACVAYMKDDSGGYEIYRATLDSAEAALRVETK